MRNSSNKTPWYLRFCAPGAVLRKKAITAVLALATLLTASIEQAEAASIKPKPKPKPNPSNPPGSGVGDSIAGNFIYDAITGQRVAVTSAMSGTITAIPSIN